MKPTPPAPPSASPRAAILLLLLLALAWLLPVPLRAEPAAAGRLLLSGSTTMAPLLAAIAKRYQGLHPELAIEVRMGGSGRGISDVRQGQADIGLVSRTLDDSESGLYAIPMARDGVAVIVHRDNPVRALSARLLADLYRGRVANWRQLGGHDAPVHVLAAPPEGGSSALFSHYLELPYAQLQAQRQVGPNAERIATVAGDPQAIIYVSVGEAERQARAGVPIKLLAIDGVAASSKNVRSGDYPLARPLTLVSRNAPSGATRAFIDYCLSAQVTDLIVAFNFTPYLD